MPLNKTKGNMYPWVTHTHSHLGGECPHKCTYCYVDSFRQRVPKYQGELRLIEKELLVPYGKGKTIFIEHCNDLFAENVPDGTILMILNHANRYPENIYVFQTKNPKRYMDYHLCFPPHLILGTTIETNRDIPDIGNAPSPENRLSSMINLKARKFITIEPILDFDIGDFVNLIFAVEPEFVNIGADSKRHNLPEPSMEKVQALIDKLTGHGIEIREKSNLGRLKKGK